MKSVKMTCSRCNGTMMLENHGDYSGIFCPYCGCNNSLLIESDRVKIARLNAATEHERLNFMFSERRDRRDSDLARRRIQIAIICIFALIAIALSLVFVSSFPRMI